MNNLSDSLTSFVEKEEKELYFYLITVAYDGSNFTG